MRILKNLMIIALCIVAAFFIYYLVDDDESDTNPEVEYQEPTENEEKQQELNKDIDYSKKAYSSSDELMEDIVVIINNKDSKGLYSLMTESWRDYFNLYMIAEAMKDYEIIFNGEQVVDYRYQGIREYTQDMEVYTLISESGLEKEFFVNSTVDAYFASDYVIYYSSFKNYLMNEWIKSLKDEDMEKLSMWIYHDEEGNVYPADKTKIVLEKYKELFDLETLTWEFTGEFGEYDEFICKISGEKEGVDHEHFIKVLHGDGQVALVDSFVE